MNRRDFQTIALVRLKEAQTLLANDLPDGAYYLCGYTVECALKACIARQTERYDFPPDPRTVQAIYTHDLNRLASLAGLDAVLAGRQQTDQTFAENWELVKDWSERSRYLRHPRDEAEHLYLAVADRQHGVLRWIRQYW